MKKLDTIDADTLLGIPYEPLSFIVEELLPQLPGALNPLPLLCFLG